MNAFTLKIIALATMIIDHAGLAVPAMFGLEPGINIFRVTGRVAFPVFVYLIAEGFRHTKSPGRYLARLGVFAVISEPFFDLAFGRFHDFIFPAFVHRTNIFYTLFLGGAAIMVYSRIRLGQGENNSAYSHGAALAPGIGFMWLAEFLQTDYGAFGVAFILLMYAIKPVKMRLLAMTVLCLWQYTDIFEGIIHIGIAQIPLLYLLMIPANLIPVVLLAFYNGKRGANSAAAKWFFYVAYPAHLLVLAVLA